MYLDGKRSEKRESQSEKTKKRLRADSGIVVLVMLMLCLARAVGGSQVSHFFFSSSFNFFLNVVAKVRVAQTTVLRSSHLSTVKAMRHSRMVVVMVVH